jgi:RTX calcium-binding nonapeptide repeat (4 copies)
MQMTIVKTPDFTDSITSNGDFYVASAGNGSLTVDNVGPDILFNITAPAGEEPLLVFGQGAGFKGTGTITGAGAEIILTSTGTTGNGAFVRVGASGAGELSILNGGKLSILDTAGSTSGLNQNGLDGLTVGQGTVAGGSGKLTVNAGIVDIEGTGTLMNVGRNATTVASTADFLNGSQLILKSLTATTQQPTNSNNDGSFLQVGRSFGVGVLTFNASTATLTSTGPTGASMIAGRDSGNGTINIQNGSNITINGGSVGASINLGLDSVTGTNAGVGSGGTGVLNVTGSTILAVSTGGGGFLNVGRNNNANGTATFNSGTTATFRGDTGAGLNVALNGNASTIGNMTVNTGAVINIDNKGTTIGTNSAGLNIGSTGTGTLTVNGGIVHFTSLSTGFGNIGHSGSTATATGTGTLNISNDGLVDFNLASSSNLAVGRGAGSSAAINVTTGGVLDLNGTTGTNTALNIGDRLGTTSAVVTVNGLNSQINGVGRILVGSNSTDGGYNGIGNGQLVVASSGIVTGQTVLIGEGGRLSGNGGRVNGQLFVNMSGTLGDAADALQTMIIGGDVTINGGGAVHMDVGAGGNDSYQVLGSLLLNDDKLTIDAVGGYKFAAGEQRMLVLVTGTTAIAGGVDGSEINVTNQIAGFGFITGAVDGTASYGIRALNSGATGGAAVLDFGQASLLGANFNYNSTTGLGGGSGGSFGGGYGISAHNVTEVRTTDVSDFVNISGNIGVTIYTYGGNDNILGGGGVDVIYAGAGNDTLNGGVGADLMLGGAGDDIYTIDDFGDHAFESVGEGTDTVNTSVSYVIEANVENVNLTGIAANNDGVLGNNLANIINGNAGNNGIAAGDGNDTISTFAGNDVLDGGLGADQMSGGLGSDVYFVDNAGDQVLGETAEAGVYDTVWTTVSFTLPSEVEILILNGGVLAINGTGNAGAGGVNPNLMLGNNAVNVLTTFGGDDIILGLDGNDTISAGGSSVAGYNLIVGGNGNDLMTAGSGHDFFAYSNISEAGDTINAFTTAGGNALDILDLRTMFTTFTGAASANAAAAIANGHLTFTQMGGDTQVFVDADGGANNQVLLATLTGTTTAAVQVVTLV